MFTAGQNVVGRSGKLLLAFASTVILGFGLHGAHGYTFLSHDSTTKHIHKCIPFCLHFSFMDARSSDSHLSAALHSKGEGECSLQY
jgi:hypothetical protein